MNSKHTPGPWYVTGRRESDNTLEISDSPTPTPKSTLVANVAPRPHYANNQQANAALIAAAPTMLEQLKEAVRLMVYYRPRDNYPDGSVIQGPSEILRKLYGSIALAEGRDPGEGVADADAAIARAEGR